jgi:predicted lipoprotein with Yx(FWY)xxD motif
MPKKIVAAAVAAIALAAAGAAAAAVVTHQSSASSGTVNLRQTKLGKVLAAKTGKTLYLFMADHGKTSACYGKCATFWPPLTVSGKATAGTGVKSNLLGVTMRKNGKHQVTYKGHPLYFFKLDKKAGQISGQRQDFFGGLWYVVSSSGVPIKKAAPSGGGTTTGTTTGTNPYTTTGRY